MNHITKTDQFIEASTGIKATLYGKSLTVFGIGGVDTGDSHVGLVDPIKGFNMEGSGKTGAYDSSSYMVFVIHSIYSLRWYYLLSVFFSKQ
jgi:hypothetical protein